MAYHPKIIDFYQKHNMYDKKIFEYLEYNTTLIDYDYEEERDLIGCFYVLNKKEILRDIKLVIPFVSDEMTSIINIHEITHGIENYYKMGKIFQKDLTIETMPLLYEKLYILENPTKKMIQCGKYLDSMITKDSPEEYRFALYARDKLLEEYNYNMANSQALAKKLVKKYK